MGLLRRLAQNGPPAGFNIPSGATGPPAGFNIPSGATGPPAGFTPPPGMTGPPPSQVVAAQTSNTHGAGIPASILSRLPSGVTIPAGVTGPPAGITPPPGMTGPPPGVVAGGGSHGPAEPPVLMDSHDLSVIIGVTTMFLVLCLAVVAGRLLSRRMVKQKLGLDDWTAVAALLALIGLATEQYLLAVNGGGTGIPSIARFHVLGKLELGSQITYNFVTNLAKLSILFLYKRVFNLRLMWFRVSWWCCIALVAINFLILLIVNLLQCAPHPPSALWNNRAQCMGFNKTSAVAMGFINAAIDLAILILPIRMTWRLQMPKKQKFAISSVFGLGLAGVAVSIARAASLASPNVFSKGIIEFAVWSTAEPTVALICACLPVMRPLFISITKVISSTGTWRTSSWGWSRGAKPPNKSSGAGSASSKTLTNNSVTSGGRTFGREKAGAGAAEKGFLLRADSSFGSSHPYVKVETTIESNEMELRSPLPPPPPSYPVRGSGNAGFNRKAAPASTGYNHHAVNCTMVAGGKGLQRGNIPLGEADILRSGDDIGWGRAKSQDGEWRSPHFCEMCQEEARTGWE